MASFSDKRRGLSQGENTVANAEVASAGALADRITEEASRVLGEGSFRRICKSLEFPDDKQQLRATFEELLRPLYEPHAVEAQEKLRRARLICELAIAEEIASDASKREAVKSLVLPIHRKMRAIGGGEPGDLRQLWDSDAAFHATLGEIAQLPEMVNVVVTAIKDAVSRIGVARDETEMRQTLAEHHDILEAITSEAPDYEQIERAVQTHVQNSFDRWIEHARTQSPLSDGRLPDELKVRIDAVLANEVQRRRRDLTVLEADRIRWDLRYDFSYPGEYVAFREETVVIDGVNRLTRHLVRRGAWSDVSSYLERSNEEELATISVEYVQPHSSI